MNKLVSLMIVLAGACAFLCADSMYGAFQVVTKPSGADVTLYDPDLYLAQTPTPVYPVVMDEYMELREGIPGREIMLMVTKKGYVPLKREIFVPFTHEADSLAMAEPSVFRFELEHDKKNKHWRVCVYYGYRHRRPRPHHYVHFHPWYPPGHYHNPGWVTPPPEPPVIYQGDLVSGTPDGPDLTASGSGNAPGNYKPNHPKYEKRSEPPKYSVPAINTKPDKSEQTNKASSKKKTVSKTENEKPAHSKTQPSKSTNLSSDKQEKVEEDKEKDTGTKAKPDSKSKK